ncbi:CPBP family glutamic-type intramembrane protease [Lutibacter citreus]|uniref:CPBP family glutamic-type intramembrane protease n=1 Tax=Lutibacter citreus TaxID=2138210 RepID=UPI001300465F|nr:CPBP family glutamic-type intramembrane protease [Lutibacter citreus]
MSTLKNLWILSKNGFVKEEKRTLKDSIRFLIKLFLFLFLVKILYLGLTLLINLSDTITLPVISNDFKFDRYSGIQKFFLGALLAPIFEELTFRLGLKFSKRNILMLFAGITYSILKLIIQLDWNTSLLIVAMTTLTLGLILNNKILDILAEFWKNNRLVIFYFLLLSFALFHSTNYDLDFSTLLYIPIIMLPHFLAGLIYSYARLKSGIILTICLHILNNALFAFPLLFAD